ncbi:unnamed protein product [Oppiella nova]|uniref:Uncharacterized protein n=1 Tax=Oppiella nova TaxID=334625 RepID=A0A7R9QY86_9ACAR|nr:unnamed protein product [Oppiella nova]CAG2178523.1 unnamed protein product [Oppiella nova]
MGDKKSFSLQAVKWFLICMYGCNWVYSLVFIITGILHYNTVESDIQVFKEEVRDFSDSYDPKAIFFIVLGFVSLILMTYVIYVTYYEHPKQSTGIAVLFILMFAINILFGELSVKVTVGAILTVFMATLYAYLVDKQMKVNARRGAQDMEMDVNGCPIYV